MRWRANGRRSLRFNYVFAEEGYTHMKSKNWKRRTFLLLGDIWLVQAHTVMWHSGFGLLLLLKTEEVLRHLIRVIFPCKIILVFTCA